MGLLPYGTMPSAAYSKSEEPTIRLVETDILKIWIPYSVIKKYPLLNLGSTTQQLSKNTHNHTHPLLLTLILRLHDQNIPQEVLVK